MTMTGSPALAAIWTSRSRSFPVGMPETARRKFLPRLPCEGRLPVRSRPSARASAKPGLQRPEADGLGIPLSGGGIPARPACLPADRDREPRPDPADASLQARSFSSQVLPGQPGLVLAGAGERAGPPGRRGCSQRSLPHRPGPRSTFRVQPSLRAPGGQVLPGQRTQVRTRGPQHLLIPRADPQPSTDPRAARAAATYGAATGRREAVSGPPPARPGRPAGKRFHVRNRPLNYGNS
jgi:hypothetical protein